MTTTTKAALIELSNLLYSVLDDMNETNDPTLAASHIITLAPLLNAYNQLSAKPLGLLYSPAIGYELTTTNQR